MTKLLPCFPADTVNLPGSEAISSCPNRKPPPTPATKFMTMNPSHLPGFMLFIALTGHLDGGKAASHDAISDYLHRKKLTPRGLWVTVQPLLDDGPGSYLIVDDSVQDKRYAKKIELVYPRYSGDMHGVVDNIGVVNLVHTNGQDHRLYPNDYRIFDPDGDRKTKHDHFRDADARRARQRLKAC